MSAGDRIDPDVDAWIAAIHASRDDLHPVGSGIVLDERRIMTCFHVIEKMAEKWVAFPRARDATVSIRRRVERVILPKDHSEARDLAILVLSESVPPGVTAAPLCFPEPLKLHGMRWWAFGFPYGAFRGSTAEGRVGDRLSYGWLRLHGESLDKIEVGFSGGGLWCPDYGAVIAIVGQVDVDVDGNVRGGGAIALCDADKWFPGEDLRGLADRKAVPSAVSSAHPAPEVAELAVLLAEHPDALALIHEVFRRTPAVAPLGATIIQLLGRLHELVPPSGESPLLQQVRELAAQRTVEALRATLALGATSTDRSAEGPCLLVVLRRNGFAPNEFLLSLTLFEHSQPGQPQECGKSSGSLKEIQELLREVVPQILDARRGLPLVEFAVPENLIDTAFDQWPVARRPDRPRAEDYRLGEKYPVVVRDLDRMDSAVLSVRDRERWEHRWTLLHACEGPAGELLRMVDLQDVVGRRKEAVFHALAAEFRLPEADGKAVLALLPEMAAAPGKRGNAQAGRAIAEALKAALAEGMPAAIWLRNPGSRRQGGISADGDGADQDDRTYLEKALDHANSRLPALLRDLPRRVWILRTDGAAGQCHASHPGRRLTLLWADPSHSWSPRDFQLPAPSTNGADL